MAFTKKQREERKNKGLCIECNNLSTANSLRCEKCNKRRNQWRKKKYHQWKEKGLCPFCGVKTLSNKNVCEKHYLIQVSLDRLGTRSLWKELKELLEKQKYKCALTGDSISLETDIELDHIIPTSNSGKQELSNVRWVTKEANRLKQDLTDEKLKELCKKILKTI